MYPQPEDTQSCPTDTKICHPQLPGASFPTASAQRRLGVRSRTVKIKSAHEDSMAIPEETHAAASSFHKGSFHLSFIRPSRLFETNRGNDLAKSAPA